MNEQKENKKIVTRFAPSPTGLLHAGSYRTALFSYLYARQNGGKFVLRIEDTDKERSKKEYEENILESLKWMGLEYDEFYRQSERVENHKKHLLAMIEKGFAYVSREEKDGKTNDLIRFKNPGTKVTFHDLIRGEITMDTTDLKDFVLAKNIDTPLFHLAVVVDDFEMGITHIVRGDDHISNTPRQILIQRAIGAPEPVYAHLPLVLAPDRTKLSKRKGALAISEYRDLGYLPEALLNFMALLGWNPGTDQEILSKQDLIEKFHIEKIQKGGAIFDTEKLKWLNKEYIKKLPLEKVAAMSEAAIPEKIKKMPQYSEHQFIRVLPVILEHISTFGEMKDAFEKGEFDYFFEAPTFAKESLLWKTEKDLSQTARHLNYSLECLSKVSADSFTKENTKAAIWKYAQKEGRGNVLWPLRFSLSGKQKSPDPFMLCELLGKDEVTKRIQSALALL